MANFLIICNKKKRRQRCIKDIGKAKYDRQKLRKKTERKTKTSLRNLVKSSQDSGKVDGTAFKNPEVNVQTAKSKS